MSDIKTQVFRFEDKFVKPLTLLFIGLKLTGHISWGWLWVVSPLWIYFILSIVAGVITGIFTSLSNN